MRHAAAAFAILSLLACSASGPAGSAASDLSGPFTHGNLTVYLIHSAAPQREIDCLTLEEALQSGAVKITEKTEGADVNELHVENVGTKPVYLQAGDTVKGGQQDRTIAVDALLPPKSGKRSIDAFCVEPGRWEGRDNKSDQVFGLAQAPVATNEQKLAVRLDKDQSKVWAAGRKVNRDLVQAAKVEAPAAGGNGALTGATFALEEAKDSYVLAVEDPAVKKKLEERIAALEKAPADRKDVVGAVFCMNGKVQSAEMYPANGLFRKLWPKLLRSAAVDAISQQKNDAAVPVPSEADVRALLTEMADGASVTEQRQDGPTVRIMEKARAVRFDTEADGRLLHRQVLAK
jgi:hypothetical protein